MQSTWAIETGVATLSGVRVEAISKLGGRCGPREIGDLAKTRRGKNWIRKENARLARRFNEAIQDKSGFPPVVDGGLALLIGPDEIFSATRYPSFCPETCRPLSVRKLRSARIGTGVPDFSCR